MMITIASFIQNLERLFPSLSDVRPWEIPAQLEPILMEKIKELKDDDYVIRDKIAIHRSATIEDHVVLKGTVIISENCFVGAHAYLRGGVFLDAQAVVGPGCEVKSSMIMAKSALAHFNFVGDSLLGTAVNMEAGSVIANHYNERDHKEISAIIQGKSTPLGIRKFGAIVGDFSKIGANAVLSPGTILGPRSIVKRLELIEQCKLGNV